MKSPGSIGVLIPTRNSAALLPKHVASLSTWIELAAEVVVVDSESTDGTVAYLKQHLRHPNARFLQHPRGLYQSWNFGIKNVSATYTYISTVGDTITRDGIQQLHQFAENFSCDVVVSKPRMVDEAERAMPDSHWPIDDLLEKFSRRPLVLGGAGLFLFAVANYTGAILGSSASNLYRTACLQERPFPTEFGTVGDGAWGFMNALDSRLGVSAEKFSTFLEHQKSYAPSEYAVVSLNHKLIALAEETFARRVAASPELRSDPLTPKIEEALQIVKKHEACQERLEICRRQSFPWVLNPAAWTARMKRDAYGKALVELKRSAVPEMERREINPQSSMG